MVLNYQELLNKEPLRDYVNIEDDSTAVKIINDQIMKLINELNQANIIREKIKEQIKDLNRVALYLKRDYESVDLFHNQRWKLVETVFGKGIKFARSIDRIIEKRNKRYESDK